MTAYRVHAHTSLAEVRGLPGSTELEAASDDLFYTLAWFENLERHGIGADERVMTLCIERDTAGAREAIVLPLGSRRRGQAAVYGPVLGGLSNYYSSLFGPMGHPAQCTTEACRAAVRHLRRSGSACAVIDLQPLDEQAPFFQAMLQAMRDEGYIVDTYFCFGNWHLQLAGRSYDAYVQAVPSRIRNTIRRGRKKLDATAGSNLRIVTAASDDLESAITDFNSVYQRSWKIPEPFPEFVPNLIRTAARCGWLRLGIVRLGDVPIAAQLWLVRDGRALIYKLAYDEDHKRFSAGSILTAELMRHVIDIDRVAEVDYLTGDDAYKVDWMSHRRERRGIVAFDPRTAQGVVSAARHFGARWWSRIRATRASQPEATGSHADIVDAPSEPSARVDGWGT